MDKVFSTRLSQIFFIYSSTVTVGQWNIVEIISNLRSQEWLRQINTEAISSNRISNDLITDISVNQEYYRDLLSEKPIPGNIQYFVKEPFIMHLYMKRQIKVLKYLANDVILHLDAAVSIIP
ncbi:hypothetical protein LOD99_8179 [Oopsacas minuta]|uniref:Uncharacterized protein n=1 Tax=Oopsacas minuta TaxID=111878 RepID=A0AAV7JHU2_9METZ|nr:hypothetical protein LOD99_8179 [Oopsacas minuta]